MGHSREATLTEPEAGGGLCIRGPCAEGAGPTGPSAPTVLCGRGSAWREGALLPGGLAYTPGGDVWAAMKPERGVLAVRDGRTSP